QRDLIVITIVGDIDFDQTEQLISDIFDFNTREYLPILLDTKMKQIEKVTEVIQEIDVNQAKLVVGYRGLPHYLADDYYSAIVFNNLFGASSESCLFKEIREEKGLVYFISSNYDPYKGVMFVTSGINDADYEEVVRTTDEVLKTIVHGKITKEQLEVSKNIIINHLIESLDSPHAIMTRFQRNSLFGLDFNIDYMIEMIQQVTIFDVASVAKSLQKDTVYLLRGEKHD
ncbi:MAG: insulinase family protein, partial [Bacilli bacterium]|nr:insulinase family protein [Bacilli bacterium]